MRKAESEKKQTGTKAVIYARYSCDNQREESIEGQIRENMEFAENAGIEVIDTYIDRAYSAKTDNRPEFQRMIKDSNKHVFQLIIVWKLDRFARNRYDSAHYKAILKKNDVKVISATETIAEGSEGILLESVLEGMAEYYSADLSEKVKRGMTENALKGLNNGMSIPIGYKLNSEDKLEIDEILAPVVREIFRMYASGKTAKTIERYLKEKGIKTRKGGDIKYGSIQYMLSNRKYIGEYKFDKIVIPDGIPRLIDDKLFEAVQEMLKKNKKAPARHKADDDYLLTLKLFCGKCGGVMVGESGHSGNKKNVHHYYKCQNNKRYKTCDRKAIRKNNIEDLVVEEAMKMLNDDKLLKVITDSVYEAQKEENVRLPALQAQLVETAKRLENVMNAIEQGIISSTTKDRLLQLENEKKELSALIAKEQIKAPFLTKNQIMFFFRNLRKTNIKTKEGKQVLIDVLIKTVFVYDDKLLITFNYKDSTRTVSLSEVAMRSDNRNACEPTFSDKKAVVNKKARFMQSRPFFAKILA